MTDPNIPVDSDGEPFPPMNAAKVPAPEAISSSYGEEDPDA
ncbi:hypothetical protein LLS1_18420 [Leifsonia sp. LS1]|nr:hypothetical protein [Leifsonia sp. LS1]GIT80173.1 hypothetical protein LLS1_18420 [Leifsonia sp. LS1]